MTAPEHQALLDLAARVEAMDGPSREVDVLIGIATDWKHRHAPCSMSELANLMSAEEMARDAESHQSILKELPRYTASLDAAMQLVPPEYGFQVDGYGDHWWASLSEDEGFNANCRTPALTLTAAALRARAMMEPQDEH